MHRRTLLTHAITLTGLPALTHAASAGGIRFGVISDLHQDIMHDAIERVTAFVDAMTAAKADFIVQLGDFCVPVERNREFLAAWNRFPGPRWHVLGNHDMDGGRKRDDVVAFLGMPSRHYSFDAGGVTFVVLDGNDRGGKARGYARFVADDQLQWLESTLAAAALPVVVLVHQPLDHDDGVENHAAVRALIEKPQPGRPGVAAVLSGHLHQDYLRTLNGIAHVQINSASYVWLGEKGRRMVYPEPVHQAHPHLASVAPYRDPLWAMVVIDAEAGTLTLTGRSTEWVGPDPWQRGAPESSHPRTACRPAISDRSLSVRRPAADR